MNFKKSWKRANDGFTLVELIVVIAILAILAGIAVPAYSGYIKKANKAADLQLLAAVNTAYAAAVMENDVATDIKTVSGSIALSGPQGAMRIAKVGPEKYNEAFMTYYAGNTGSAFKVITKLVFENGAFVDAADSGNYVSTNYRGNTVYVNQAQLSTLTNSTLGSIGAEDLLTEVSGAVEWADGFGLAQMGGDAYWNAVMSYVGIEGLDLSTVPAESRYDAVMGALIDSGVEEDVAGAMVANSTAIYAAQNTTNVTTESVSKWLTGDATTDSLKESGTATTLAEASAIYGLYMSYAESNGKTLSGDPLFVVGDALEDPDFADWVADPNSTAQTELDAYKSAMSIITDAAGDDSTREALLANGFADGKLIEMMEGLMGN